MAGQSMAVGGFDLPSRIMGYPSDDLDGRTQAREIFRYLGCVRSDSGGFGPVVDSEDQNSNP
jgi:hypothetical protein